MKNKKILTIALAAGAALMLIIGYSIITLMSRIGKAKVLVQYAPFTSSIQLNGQYIKNNKVNYIEPGHYTVVASQDGFATLTEEVEISNDTENLFGMLTAETDEARRIENERIGDYQIVEALFGQLSQEEGEQEKNNWPILADLPVMKSIYQLGYLLDKDAGNLTLTITASESSIDIAVQDLRNLSADVTVEEYEVMIYDYNDQFDGRLQDNDATDPIEYVRNGLSWVGGVSDVAGETQGEQYYCAIVTSGSAQSHDAVTHRMILERDSDGWRLASAIYPILTVKNSPNVPEGILIVCNTLEAAYWNSYR